jgi:hypothetical protein
MAYIQPVQLLSELLLTWCDRQQIAECVNVGEIGRVGCKKSVAAQTLVARWPACICLPAQVSETVPAVQLKSRVPSSSPTDTRDCAGAGAIQSGATSLPHFPEGSLQAVGQYFHPLK